MPAVNVMTVYNGHSSSIVSNTYSSMVPTPIATPVDIHRIPRRNVSCNWIIDRAPKSSKILSMARHIDPCGCIIIITSAWSIKVIVPCRILRHPPCTNTLRDIVCAVSIAVIKINVCRVVIFHLLPYTLSVESGSYSAHRIVQATVRSSEYTSFLTSYCSISEPKRSRQASTLQSLILAKIRVTRPRWRVIVPDTTKKL